MARNEALRCELISRAAHPAAPGNADRLWDILDDYEAWPGYRLVDLCRQTGLEPDVTDPGVLKLTNVPQAGAGKDYQLWVIDPKYPAPVSGGLVPVNAEGIARVSFAPDRPISRADKFAISLEPAGGVPKATGPIVLLGGN